MTGLAGADGHERRFSAAVALRSVSMLAAVVTVAAACTAEPSARPPAGADDPAPTAATEQPASSRPPADGAAVDPGARPGRADVAPSGNRVATGAGSIGRVEPIDVPLPARPIQVLPLAPTGGGHAWLVELEGAEPVVVGHDGSVEPAPAEATARADLGSELFTDPLPDGRVVTWETVAVALVAPTDRYPHGVLGDELEASAVQVVDEAAGTAAAFGPEPPSVIEGLAPLLADLDGDGTPEVLVTQSNADVGAWLALWTLDGRLLAESEPIGRGNRWRNQLAVAPIGPGGEIEVIDVRTPHIGGTVEFFRLDGDRLVLVASIGGFTNHVIGSRNLDLGIVADADGDGALDVVLPTDDRSALGVLRRVADGVEVTATMPLDGRLVTNVAVGDDGGRLAFAAGTDTGVLRIWPPA